MKQYLKSEFKNPSSDRRSIPFWSWNDKMDPEEIKYQVRKMKEAGGGGFFIHSRIGLETEYLSDEWMNCVKAAVAEAKEQGLYAWIYDEDRWPSGTAGGRVTALEAAYQCKGLTLEIIKPESYAPVSCEELTAISHFGDTKLGLLSMYRGKFDRERLIEYERLNIKESPNIEEGDVLLAVRLEVSASSAWFNNSTPPDNLNPDCVKQFIQETHERYKEVIGDEFGKTVKGVFTDEPSLNDRFSYFGENKSWIPWTFGFGDYYKKENGYDFFDVLPCFYFETNNSKKIRHDYWKCAAKRYRESYFKVIGDWCRENNLLFSGHMLHEDSMGICTRVNGAIMPSYQYMDVPGIDMLCEQTEEYMTVKQCTSVAHQLSKKQVLTETYGCTGWDFTFEGQKWIGDWQYVLGVNRRCQHLMLYSLRGCRKRDYPPNFNYNTNWWPYNKIVEDYFARLSVVLEQGEPVRNILMLHPVSTAWSRLGVNPYGNPTRDGERDIPELDNYGREFNGLIELLERHHYDLDLGDECLLAQYGNASEGKLFLGDASYEAVVIPVMDTMLATTCEMLLSYMEQGGVVYALEPGISAVEGSEHLKEKYKMMLTHKNWKKIYSKEVLLSELEVYRKIKITDLKGTECEDVLYQLRKDGDEYYLFLVNNSRKKEQNIVVEIPIKGKPSELELIEGDIVPFKDYEVLKEGLRLNIHLPKTGSILLCFNKDEAETGAAEAEEGIVLEIPDEAYEYSLENKNVLTLDCCKYRINGGTWSENMEVWKAQSEIRKSFDMRQITSNGIEQRYKWIGKPHPNDGNKVELAFEFCGACAFENVALAVERPEEFQFFFNGEPFAWETKGYLLDKEIKTSIMPDIPSGKNEILLSCNYRNDMELEMIYLEGDFGVDAERNLMKLPDRLELGDWSVQGLKHYCGSVVYHWNCQIETAQRVWLKLLPVEAVCVEISVNGSKKAIPWNYEQQIEITKWISQGENKIDIIVAGSPRNMMGPFHLTEKPYNTNADCFCEEGEYYTPEYKTVPYGIQRKRR